MRILLVALMVVMVAFAGCLNEEEPDSGAGGAGGSQSGGGTDQAGGEGSGVAAGTELGQLTYEDSGSISTAVTQPDCFGSGGVTESHQWQIPTNSPDGDEWKIRSVTVTLTKTSNVPSDLDLVLQQNGQTLDRATEQGPDQGNTMTVQASDVVASQLTILVQACTTAAMADYDLAGTADMVSVGNAAAVDGGNDGGTPTNGVQMSESDATVTTYEYEDEDSGETHTRYKATKTLTYTASVGASAGDATFSTGAGFLEFDAGSSQFYELIASLEGKGDSEQEARDNLAQISVDHGYNDGARLALDVHARPGSGGWNDKVASFDFTVPDFDWGSIDGDTSAGFIEQNRIDADSVDYNTAAGFITISNGDFSTLDAQTSAGFVSLDDVRATDLDARSSAGFVEADMRAPFNHGTWDLHSTAGNVALNLVEDASHGYSVEGQTSAGSVTFSFSDMTEQDANCQYASCYRHHQTNGFGDRDIRTTVDMTTSAGSITGSS